MENLINKHRAPEPPSVLSIFDSCVRTRRELVSRYLTAAAAIKRRLRFRGGLPMGLLPTTCHPGSRWVCQVLWPLRRRSVMLSSPVTLHSSIPGFPCPWKNLEVLDSLINASGLKLMVCSLWNEEQNKTRPRNKFREDEDENCLKIINETICIVCAKGLIISNIKNMKNMKNTKYTKYIKILRNDGLL